MQPTSKTYVRAGMAILSGLIASSLAVAGDTMPVAQQNALVQTYCAVCHNDAHVNGGLSLQHFDAGDADPGVAAMLVSKLTGGLPLEKVNAARTDPAAAAMEASKMKTGAMGAAGIPVPDRMTQNALVSALSAEAAGASEWTVTQTQNPATQAPMLTASILRETPSPKNTGQADMYRLTLTCDVGTHEDGMQLTWAPGVPEVGSVMSAVVDGKAPVTYKVEGSEKMFHGATGMSGTGAVLLYATTENSGMPKLMKPLPEQTLTVSGLFGDETVVFPFGGLTPAVRQALSACFNGSDTGE
jgi:hypothetical protein